MAKNKLEQFLSITDQLRSFARGRVAIQEVEDLLQETMFKIVKNIDKYDDSKGKPITWARTIMRNTHLDQIRKKKVLPAIQQLEDEHIFTKSRDNDSDDIAITVESLTTQQPDRYVIDDITNERIKLLTNQERIILQLIADGYKYAEVSELLGMKIGTFKPTLHRIRKFIITGERHNLTQSKPNVQTPLRPLHWMWG